MRERNVRERMERGHGVLRQVRREIKCIRPPVRYSLHQEPGSMPLISQNVHVASHPFQVLHDSDLQPCICALCLDPCMLYYRVPK
eukprot:1355144-Rhodomonas_salina.1